MSAAILDRARAFAAIAEFLPADDREAIAKAIGARIKRECGPVEKSEPGTPREVVPDPVHAEHDEATQFLIDHGYSSGDLVRAAGRLAEFLKHHPNLTREAGMRVWLSTERGEER